MKYLDTHQPFTNQFISTSVGKEEKFNNTDTMAKSYITFYGHN